MRKFSFIIGGIAIAALIISACQKKGLMDYAGPSSIYFQPIAGYPNPNSTPQMYFVVKRAGKSDTAMNFAASKMDAALNDTMWGNFGLFYSDDATACEFMMPFRITGDTSAVDRKFKLRVIDTATNTPAADFSIDPEKCIVKAGKTEALIPISFKRTQAMKSAYQYVTVELEAGFDFSVEYNQYLISGKNFKNTLRRTFGMLDQYPAPTWWRGNNSYGASMFGKFSKTKFLHMVDYFGIPEDGWSGLAVAQVSGYAQLFNCHLKRMITAGTPVMDKDDLTGEVTQMSAGTSASSVCDL
ncbi:DUF4843 domain-containing protein [Chitinophaga sedimenti]|uniref:DUF4843 domain-containing protein n=1 Tax=Chitinophaga sedimenti TaxID=2033606 RepID=UPI00200370B2|nr:DUF4843 domain-containing protein [Chitinophaga sedimenti]MCK7557404.1 DUF4843 domain-containing protein [Chitinophaga sedimenti]